MFKKVVFAVSLSMLAAPLLSSYAVAQDSYPSRPISLIVPFPAGGAADVLARVVAKQLGQELGQPIVIENRAGAATAIGAGYVSRAAADGYTLLSGTGTTFTVNPAIQSNLPYDPVRSFEPIGIIGRSGLALLANPQVPVNNLQEFVAYAKSHENEPPPFGSFGSGSSAHFMAESFIYAAKIKMTHIPYKGSAPSMTDLIGGQIPFAVDTVAATLPQSKQGKVRVLAISAPARSKLMPQVPTFAELGYPSVVMDTWQMIVAPAGLPPEVKAKLEVALKAAANSPEVRASLEKQGFESGFVSAADAATLIQRESAQVKELAAHVKIEPN